MEFGTRNEGVEGKVGCVYDSGSVVHGASNKEGDNVRTTGRYGCDDAARGYVTGVTKRKTRNMGLILIR